jgi:hypothetical protein
VVTIDGHVDVPKHNETALMQSVSHTVGACRRTPPPPRPDEAAGWGATSSVGRPIPRAARFAELQQALRLAADPPHLRTHGPPKGMGPRCSCCCCACCSTAAACALSLCPALPPLQPTVVAVCCGEFLDQWHL